MSNRDQQFQRWASAVLSKMFEATNEHMHGDSLDLGSEEAQQAMLQVVARAGYDLACHVYRHTGVGSCDPELGLYDVPDLPVLPEETNK